MGKAKQGDKPETADFPTSVYGIIPNALSELSEVIALIRARTTSVEYQLYPLVMQSRIFIPMLLSSLHKVILWNHSQLKNIL